MKKEILVAKGSVVEFFVKGELKRERVTKVTEKRAYFGKQYKPRSDVKVLF